MVKFQDTNRTHETHQVIDLTQKRGIIYFNILWFLLTFVFEIRTTN